MTILDATEARWVLPPHPSLLPAGEGATDAGDTLEGKPLIQRGNVTL